MISKLLVSVAVLSCPFALCVAQTHAQTSGSRSQMSYSDYYSKNVTKYRRPSVNPARYTADRVYYKNPAVSPYLNLMRPSGARYGSNYYQYVRPEENRREQAARQGISGAGRGGAASPGANAATDSRMGTVSSGRNLNQGVVNSNYYKHFYGGGR